MPAEDVSEQPALRLVGLRRDYGDRTALDGVGLELGAGESLVVLGPNGAGKTTLLRILATLLRPSGGEVLVLGCSLPREAWKLRGKIGYLGHEPLLYRDLTGRENLRFHARLHGLSKAEADDPRSTSSWPRSGWSAAPTSGSPSSRPGCASGSPSAAASCTGRELLLLDEPDSNLDVEGRELARGLIGPESGATRVIVTHDPERFLPEADKVLRLGINELAAVS